MLQTCMIDYVDSKEGRISDRVIDAACAAYQYIVEGKLDVESSTSPFKDYDTAKLLWLFLFYWGNIEASPPPFNRWSRSQEGRLVKILRERSWFLREIVWNEL